jgi:DNA polymerase-3 subunit alpha
LGCEFYFAPDGIKSKSKNTHLVLLCKNYTGWLNLLKLNRFASEVGFYYKPRIDFELLEKYKEGLIALTACIHGVVGRAILENQTETAISRLKKLKNIMNDDLYVEVQNHDIPEEHRVYKTLIEMAKKFDIKIVGTNDYHYANKEDAIVQDIMMCDGIKGYYNDSKRLKFSNNEFYIKSSEEMEENFKSEYLEVTYEIANKCNVEWLESKTLFPKIKDAEKKFDNIIKEKWDKYIKNNELCKNRKYHNRINKEIKIIKDAGLINYFLTVADFIKYAKEQNIPVGPSRGSVAGSLVAYLMNIHEIDPIEYRLMFTRFYNPGRAKSLPDIDIDFSAEKIPQMFEYVKEKYGYSNLSHIGTFTTYAPKGTLKAVCRILQVPFDDANKMTNLIPSKVKTLKEALRDSAIKKKYYQEDIYYGGQYKFKDLYDLAIKIEGRICHKGIHAAGVLISPVELDTLIPLRKDKKTDLLISDWDMEDVEKSGLIKFDFLKLDILDAINETHPKPIPMNDKKTFDFLAKDNCVGIFQLSSDVGSNIINQIKPQDIKDIAVSIAMNRPGVLNLGIDKKYFKRKNGEEYEDIPMFKDILKDTYGLIIYQEQVVRICMALGFDALTADTIRKAMGKKIPGLMTKVKPQFIEKALKHLDKETTEKLWDNIYEASEYLFNLSHAIGYAHISYYTAYLKCHYSIKYMCSLLNIAIHKPDKLQIYLEECRQKNIKILPPCVNESEGKFIVKNKSSGQKKEDLLKRLIFDVFDIAPTIRYGLLGVKGLGQEIINIISKNKYIDLMDFGRQTSITKGYLEILIKSGALDTFGYNKNTLLQNIDNIILAIKTYKKHFNSKTQPLFDYKINLNLPEYKELSIEKLSELEYETLNCYIQHNPLEGYYELIEKQTSIKLEDKSPIQLAGYVQSYVDTLTKKGKPYIRLDLYTPQRIWKVFFFGETYEAIDFIKKNKIIWVFGTYNRGSLIVKNWGNL